MRKGTDVVKTYGYKKGRCFEVVFTKEEVVE